MRPPEPARGARTGRPHPRRRVRNSPRAIASPRAAGKTRRRQVSNHPSRPRTGLSSLIRLHDTDCPAGRPSAGPWAGSLRCRARRLPAPEACPDSPILAGVLGVLAGDPKRILDQPFERVVVLGVEAADPLQPDPRGPQAVRQQPAGDEPAGCVVASTRPARARIGDAWKSPPATSRAARRARPPCGRPSSSAVRIARRVGSASAAKIRSRSGASDLGIAAPAPRGTRKSTVRLTVSDATRFGSRRSVALRETDPDLDSTGRHPLPPSAKSRPWRGAARPGGDGWADG